MVDEVHEIHLKANSANWKLQDIEDELYTISYFRKPLLKYIEDIEHNYPDISEETKKFNSYLHILIIKQAAIKMIELIKDLSYDIQDMEIGTTFRGGKLDSIITAFIEEREKNNK